MVTRDTPWPAGTPCWIDIGVPDLGKAAAFYSALFGWDVQAGPPETGGYSIAHVGGRSVAGIGPQMSGQPEPVEWTTYLATEDADQTAAKITAAGGRVLMEPMDVMDVGRMFIALDPGGARFGVWQARAHTGFQLANEPGTLIWSENMSRDFAGNKAFYAAVFGYTYGDIGAETYATLDIDGRPVGGIGELGSEQPADRSAAWGTYFAVPDTDAAVARAVELGGTVVAPAWDTPYGRMAVVADDQGGEFAVMAPNPDMQG
jgi:uncharacterized protein